MRFAPIGLGMAVVLFAIIPGTASPAAAISLTDYKFPESTAAQAILSGGLTSAGARAQGQTAWNLAGSGSYDYFRRSLPFTWVVHMEADGAAARPDTAGTPTRGSYDTSLETHANKYLSDNSSLFWYGRTSAEYRAQPRSRPDHPYWDVAVGAGYGRTIDATVLKQAIRIEEDFQKYHIIRGDIPDDALLELAGLIDRRDEYRSRYGSREYRKYWYEDMAEVLRRSGVLQSENLPAMGVIRIQEILDLEPTARRYYGWEARAGLGYVASDFTDSNEDPFLEVGLDWAHPLGITFQFTDNATLSTRLSGNPVYTLDNGFELVYEFSDRIHWDNTLSTAYAIDTASGAPDPFTLGASSSFLFYLANQLNFGPTLNYARVDRGVGSPDWNWTLHVDLLYRLW